MTFDVNVSPLLTDNVGVKTNASRAETVERWRAEVRPLTFIVALDLRVAADEIAEASLYDLRLVLAESDRAGARLVELRCRSVEGLHLEQLNARDGIGPLELEDVRARGWNGPGWLVADPEQDDTLRFRCEIVEWRSLGGSQGTSAAGIPTP